MLYMYVALIDTQFVIIKHNVPQVTVVPKLSFQFNLNQPGRTNPARLTSTSASASPRRDYRSPRFSPSPVRAHAEVDAAEQRLKLAGF